MKIINDNEFKTVVEKSEKPVVIDFFTNWCPPCKMLGPVMEKIAEEYKDKIEFIKMDLDECPNTGNTFAVDRIPTVIFLSNGKPKSSFVGFKEEAEIKIWLENNLSK
ncbi:MAG: thioredoxin [Candidatus Pacebacteria bacterium]|nr:thioredoxin [Candidatus Paceibacterota bacterium]